MDNVTLPGTGEDVATDDVGGVQYQIVKLADGTADSDEVIGGDATNGLDVDVTRVSGVVSVDDNASTLSVDDGGSTLSVDDAGGSLTVDGSVAATLAAADNVVGRVKLTDGTDVADVLDLASANPLAVAILDGSGDQIVSFGGGVQYTEADTDSSITGTAILWEDGSDTLRAVSAAKPLPVGDAGGTLTVDDGGTTLSVDDGGGTLTVDGSVTADTELTTADLDTGGGTDTRAVIGLLGSKSGGAQLIPGDATAGLKVDLGADNDVRLTDGTDVADVLDLTNSNPLVVAVVDTNGDQIASFGGGTQYTEGDTDSSITGTALLWEDTSDTLRAVSAAKPLPVSADTELTTADLDTGGGTDTRAVVGLVGSKSGGGALIPGDATAGLKVDLGADNDVTVTSGNITADTELTTADLDTGAGTDTRAVVGLARAESGGALLVGSANPLPILEIAPGTILAGQVTVSSTTTQIVGARSTRKSVVITNRQSVAIYIGATAATTSMMRLDPGDSVELPTTSRIDGITSAAYTASTDDKAHYVEVY